MKQFDTQILPALTEEQALLAITKSCEALKKSQVVAIPTETVYGLAANGLDEIACSRIFEAKGRPQDNPLILHISHLDMLNDIVSDVPQVALKLAKAFWPGPLTMIFNRKESVPPIVSAGLNTVAVRMPSHKIAIELIKMCGFPLAAPSANLSGKPSPTSAKHVMEDMNGRIPYIIDGGGSDIGIESTVLSICNDVPTILRPGKITKSDIEKNLGFPIAIDPGITEKKEYNEAVSSPGMKYTHYSPEADVKIFIGSSRDFAHYVNSQQDIYALCFEEDVKLINKLYLCYGKSNDFESQARELFGSLREFDSLGAKTVIAHAPEKSGVGLSVYNRLAKSAGFEVIGNE